MSLTAKLNYLKPAPRGLRAWDCVIDELRSYLVDVLSAADIMAAVADRTSDMLSDMIHERSGFWSIPGCRSLLTRWPNRPRSLKVFYRYIRGKAYVSGMQFIFDVMNHEVVGHESRLYTCIPVSSETRILRFVIDEIGIRSLSCSQDPSSGWSCGKPRSIGCWEGYKTYDKTNCQDCGGPCDIMVVMDVSKDDFQNHLPYQALLTYVPYLSNRHLSCASLATVTRNLAYLARILP